MDVADEVDPARIAPNAFVHPGCRILGEETSIGPDCEIGAEGPVVIDNCQLGRNVQLKGGFFSGSVFFDGANMGGGAHVRSGCILEEQASGAHSVGLKQTILLPFVAAGSLINFCDALMAGGTSRKNHSEIGSSYVHFNYTPHQDKATASLVGDVPRGVFLKKRPIFLGGQGGLIGPCRIAYGSVIAAGGVCREDVLDENRLLVASSPDPVCRPYATGVYRGIGRIVKNNLVYIGNIKALREWYRLVRIQFMRDGFDEAVLDGGLRNLDLVLEERIRRLGDLADKMEYSIQWLQKNGGDSDLINAQQRFRTEWPAIESKLADMRLDVPTEFIDKIAVLPKENGYIKTIKALEPDVREAGRAWLQGIVDRSEQLWT